ncbi:hypothetical protein LSTR_LSTR012791 [Laodelphax striatellus]|uniref:Chitin-binding type-2 domain-containing protein n=1 Tax=Laodelphax striatellus TaxID=195883 RepID=A0A482WIB4_LAOST|nr:hypothetical protein LSTR_LSTR012791 [Laodelphax striatellus]
MKYLISALIGALFAICVVEAQRRPPNYSLDEMPRTSFSCRDKIVGGYYADPETDCQMFHVCVRVAGVGVQDFRFLCPNDTSFDQENQICDDWYNIDCEASTLFYSDNFDLYRLSDGVPEFGPSRATPISLGPSSVPPVYTKPKRPHLPVNNAVGEDDDDTYLQKADTGDRRLHKDLLRGSSSGNFFANRNNGKEDNDEDDTSSAADFSKNKFGDTQAKKKTGKVAVRKLLTGKRPVQQQQTEPSTVAPTTVSSTTVANVQNNNNFGAVRQRYNTVQRNRVTTPAPYVETTTTYNNNNNNNFNNYNNNNYNNNNYNNNNYNARNNYNNYQTPTTAAPTSSVAYNNNNNNNNNFRSRGNVNFNTYNQDTSNSNNYQETSSTTQATTVNNNNFNRNYNQNYNNNNNNYNNYQYQTSTANPFNYNYQSTNNNGAQTSTKFYNTQQQNTQQQSSTTSNYYQTQQQSTNNNNNYYQQQQNYNSFNNNNYNVQTSSVASSAAYQQPTTYRTTSFNNNYQQNYNNGNNNNNYNQQSTTFNYDNYYQTSTIAPRSFDKSTTYNYYTTTVSPQPSGFQNYYEKSSTSQAVNNNNYQAKNTNYNFNVKASVGGNNNNYDPYNIYNGRGNDKYEEPTHGESLKTAPSSNIRPSDLNALAYNKEVKKNVGFNATVGTSYNFDKTSTQTKKVNPYTVAVPTTKTVTNPPVTASVVTTTGRPSLAPHQNTQYQNVQHQNTQLHQTGQHQNAPQQHQNTPQNVKKVDNKSTVAPAQSSSASAAKDNSYDYAYYDDASPSEYDGFEPVGEEFVRTAARG